MPAADGLREEMRRSLEGVDLRPSPEILSKCLNLAATLRVSPSRLAESWEAHSLNRSVSDLTAQTFDSFRASLRRDVDIAPPSDSVEGAVRTNGALGKRRGGGSEGGEGSVTPTPKRGRGGGGDGDDKDGTGSADAAAVSPSSSPGAKAKSPATGAAGAATTPMGPKYEDRTGAGTVVASYNPRDLPDVATYASLSRRRRCEVVLPESLPNVTEPFRYMFTPMEDRAKALDERLVEMGEVIAETYGIKAEEDGGEDGDGDEEGGKIAPLEAVARPRQGKVCCIGRICNEAHEGRLNRTSLLLEGSRHQSDGARVTLDVSSLTSSYSLFPGQIVAVEGVNASGLKMVASRICEGAAPPPPETSPVEMLRYHHGPAHQDGGSLRIVTACGPYTTSDNLDYAPLSDLLAQVKADGPDVVVLSGPFVDARHPMVRCGDVSLGLEGGGRMNVTYETLFVEKVAGEIEELYRRCYDEMGEELRTQFVLVPSLDDPVAECVYPQPPLRDRIPDGGRDLRLPQADGITYGTLGLHHVETAGRAEGTSKKDAERRVHRAPNPCTLRINDLVIGVTSTDVLMHISADSADSNLERGTRLTRIAQHLLQQRSYYPLFPPPAPTRAVSSPNLDHNRADGWAMPTRPDVLIVPSKLAPFARGVLDSTVVVNPGTMGRGTTGGTYAVMDVHPVKKEVLECRVGGGMEDDAPLGHGAQDRIRVDIKRI